MFFSTVSAGILSHIVATGLEESADNTRVPGGLVLAFCI